MIIPSIIAINQDEFDARVAKIAPLKYAHIDVMDGKFVKSKSFMFDCDFSALQHFDYVEIHLMAKDPFLFLMQNKELFDKASKIIVHFDANIDDVIALCRAQKKHISLAVSPDSDIDTALQMIQDNAITECLVMTVEPGFYGSPFKSSTLKTVKRLAQIVSVECDGSMTDRTLILAAKAGATHFVVGSYLQNSPDPIGTHTKLLYLSKRVLSSDYSEVF
jgi:ribulose-phosphate 3-epimerase